MQRPEVLASTPQALWEVLVNVPVQRTLNESQLVAFFREWIRTIVGLEQLLERSYFTPQRQLLFTRQLQTVAAALDFQQLLGDAVTDVLCTGDVELRVDCFDSRQTRVVIQHCRLEHDVESFETAFPVSEVAFEITQIPVVLQRFLELVVGHQFIEITRLRCFGNAIEPKEPAHGVVGLQRKDLVDHLAIANTRDRFIES